MGKLIQMTLSFSLLRCATVFTYCFAVVFIVQLFCFVGRHVSREWVSVHCSGKIMHTLSYIVNSYYLLSHLFQVSRSWLYVCVLCGPVPAIAAHLIRLEGRETAGLGGRGRRCHRGDGTPFQRDLCHWGLPTNEMASTEEKVQVTVNL